MSQQLNRQLRAGEYYGSVVRRLQVSEAILSELKHSQPRGLPAHSHEFGFFSFLLRGDYEEWYGNQTVTHRPLTLMWHPPAMKHQDKVGGRGCHFFNAEISVRRLERLRDYSSLVSEPVVLSSQDASWLMMRLYREFSAAEDGCELAVEGLLLELIAMLARHPATSERHKPLWLRQVEARIRDQFTEKLTMTELASGARVHPAHLAVVFRRFHRTTIGEFVHRLRVQAACEMLREPEAPLSLIALQLGFADQSHFSRIFHRLTGMTPKAWRGLSLACPNRERR